MTEAEGSTIVEPDELTKESLMHAPATTIPGIYTHLSHIFSHSDALTMRGRDERLAFLMMGCADLSRCVRKEQTQLYAIALAQTFAWFCCLAEDLFRSHGGVMLAKGMAEKYPKGLCAYCHQGPCVCTEVSRKPHVPNTTDNVQIDWPLSVWQSNLEKVYGKANKAGGVPRAINRLFEEVGEVGLLLYHADGVNDALHLVVEKLARELTDVLAWIFALGSLLDVDIEKATHYLYAHGCPVCSTLPCKCKNFETRPLTGGLTHRFMGAEEIYHHLYGQK